MKKLTVKVKGDHLQTLSRAKKPILAVAQLIWNSLDADARKVSVVLEDNMLGGLERIRVIDDGHGLGYEDALHEFSSLGGSWKRSQRRSKQGRLLHGRLGKGRFRAFALGGIVTWRTAYSYNGSTKTYEIIAKSDDLTHYLVSDPSESHSKPGTEVIVENIHKNFVSLRGDKAVQEIASHFALYLRQYPNVSIKYDRQIVSTVHLEMSVEEFLIENAKKSDGSKIDAKLTVIEWHQEAERSLYLCDSGGFSLAELPVGIRARGFNFTAYLKSDYIRDLDEEGVLELEELYPGLKELVDSARGLLRAHFRKRASQEASDLVRKWKDEKVYPYEEDAKNPIEEAERQVFDVCALNIHSYLPDFDEASHQSKHLAFRLLRNALETNPSAIQTILTEVLDLPKEKQSEFAELLRQTSLDAIITAARAVADRLSFLRGLELLLFDPISKKKLLERQQLHRILAQNTWIFGEEFNLTMDDQSLTELLKKHRQKFKEDVNIVDEVTREDGSRGFVDLVLGRRIPTPRGEDREHLVVELKRPNYKVDDTSLNQIRSYAFAVAEDERFRDTKTKWTFWLVSNDMTAGVHRQARQSQLPSGCVHDDADQNLCIWVKTWSKLISDCEGRLKFFQEQLQFSAGREDALVYLRREYQKYLPEVFQRSETDNAIDNAS